jgi:hypothetical protein
LYEDDGESLNYQKDIFQKTNVVCLTGRNHYEIRIKKQAKGYLQPGKRNYVFQMHVDSIPKLVRCNSKKASLVPVESLEASVDFQTMDAVWSWNPAKHVCSILIPDTGTSNEITLIR